MKTIKLSLLMFVLSFLTTTISAQKQRTNNWCASDEHLQAQKDQNPALIQVQQDLQQQVRNYIDNNYASTARIAPYIIPVVFHAITDNGDGYVSKADIEDAIITLNEDYQRLNSDASQTRAVFAPYAGAINIEFRLAHIDPNGNCTEGIVRTDSPLSTDAAPRDSVKSVSYWDSKKYFNIWTVNSIDNGGGAGILAGYAQFPTSGINAQYGIVVDHRFVGRTERTLTHEMGHCFGLLHTFQSGCGGNCSITGDQICDTPPVTTSSFGCPTTNNTCSNDANGLDPYGTNVVDQIENYMSYNDCQNMFTLEQNSTMEFFLNSTSISTGLAQLSNSTNLANTGVADPYGTITCTPNADFTFNKRYICEGASVTYTDQSWGSNATVWNWTFTGGSPSTGNTATPVITYNTAGVYGATLVASNSVPGTGSKTQNNIITVSSLTADYTGPVIDGFENTTLFNNEWRIGSDGGEAWYNTGTAAATGSRSVKLRNYATTIYRKTDSLISPSYNLASSSSPTFTFKVAYKKKNSASNDRLFIYYSLDCGDTWTLNTLLSPTAMNTTPDQSSEFTPSSASHWITKSINLSTIATETNVRFMFVFRADGGNNIFLDDININGAVGLSEIDNIGNFNIYPNPTSSGAQISFNLVKTVNNLTIKVKNAVGQEVTRVINGQSFTAGQYTLKIDKERKLSRGIYFIEFTADNVVLVQKLIVQ